MSSEYQWTKIDTRCYIYMCTSAKKDALVKKKCLALLYDTKGVSYHP